MHRLYKFIVLIVLSLLILSACGGGNQTTGGTSSSSGGTSRNLKFYVVTHGPASDPFWSVIKRGEEQAARDMGVQAIYEAPATFDMVAMSHLIDSAVAAHPDGLVDRKSTRLNSSHLVISYAVFCLK